MKVKELILNRLFDDNFLPKTQNLAILGEGEFSLYRDFRGTPNFRFANSIFVASFKAFYCFITFLIDLWLISEEAVSKSLQQHCVTANINIKR